MNDHANKARAVNTWQGAIVSKFLSAFKQHTGLDVSVPILNCLHGVEAYGGCFNIEAAGNNWLNTSQQRSQKASTRYKRKLIWLSRSSTSEAKIFGSVAPGLHAIEMKSHTVTYCAVINSASAVQGKKLKLHETRITRYCHSAVYTFNILCRNQWFACC